MTRIAIMQPTYLPWIGYFDLMATVDQFVVFDTAQFSYQSWHHRNRIRAPGGLRWLTVPVRKEGRRGKGISEIELGSSPGFPEDHVRQLRLNYASAPFATSVLPDVVDRLEQGAQTGRLLGVSLPLLRGMAAALGVDTPVTCTSALSCVGRRSELLVSICRQLGATEYVAPPGSVDYLNEDREIWERSGIAVLVHRFEHPVYPQAYTPFIPYASAVDALCNLGAGARVALDSGHREPHRLCEVVS